MPSYINRVMSRISRAPPTAPDGRGEDDGTIEKTSIFKDLTHLSGKNARTLVQAFGTIASGEPLNDKELLLENGVSMLQSLPKNSGLGDKVAGGFIKMLWEDLPHPPGTVAGPETRYRKHDGSGNNLWSPDMGKAGTPYSRSVPADKPKGPNLPDVELVYEHLLKRKGPFRPHPSGLNRMFFSFATVVIHECFQTSRQNQWINETSSYVDLSTLYGNTEKEQARVRTYHNGLVHPDTIASERIMLMPPGVVAVLVLFSRNHNTIAQSLLSINEQGKYRDWESLSEDEKKWQDEDIFQLSRNINVGFFASVVLRDYVAAILNTPRANSEWSLNLGAEIKQAAQRVQRGAGNVVSVEFAVLYHWHAALSAADAKWMEEVIMSNLPDLKSLDDVTPQSFWTVVKQEGHKLFTKPPSQWTFGGIERGEDGKFKDSDLAKIVKDCIEEPAHAFGAHGTPASLKVVDLMGQLQAREIFNVCTLNEFRRYLNLKEYDSFEEWNEDPETARAAELLYGHIDNLELYPGLQAECTKPAMPGSGVCPGQTTGRGILDDAVALVRGDRFLTYDFNSTTLTNWGVSKLGEGASGSYGGVLPHLIFTALPGDFTGTSSYALLPFYTPQATKGILQGNKAIDKYDIERPAAEMSVVGVLTHEGCRKVYEDRDNFRVAYHPALGSKANGSNLMLGWDQQKQLDDSPHSLQKIFFEDGFEAGVTKYFREHTKSLIQQATLKYPDTRRMVDIVRDVVNITPIKWLAERFAIPVKSIQHPRGLVTLAELSDMYHVLYTYQTFNIIPVYEWKLRETVSQVSPVISQIIETHLKTQQGAKEKVVDWLAKDSAFEVKPDADRLYHALNASKRPLDELVSDCIGMGAPVAGIITHQASLLIDLFLSKGYEQHKERIIALAQTEGDEAADHELRGYVFEGIRHAGAVPGLPRMAARDITVNDGERGTVQIKAHQLVLMGISKAAMDPAVFPNPEKIDPSRPASSYETLGYGLNAGFGLKMIGPALVATLKEVFRLKNLRRASGRQGFFSVNEYDIAGVKRRVYLDSRSRETNIPTSLHVLYDE